MTIRISECRNALLTLAAFAVFFDPGNAGPLEARNLSSAPDVTQIVTSSIAATQRYWQARLHYTYIERDEDRHKDSAGRMISGNVDVSRTILVNGIPFDQLVEKNGQPLSAEEQQKQKNQLDKVKRENPEQRAEQLRKQAEETASIVREVPMAFDFQLVGEEAVNGRPAYVLQATPHPGYQPQGKYGRMFPKVTGKLWVDKQDLGWIKVEGQVIHPFFMGMFFVRLLPGSQIKMEQTRVDDGIWMPARVEVQARAKIFFVKSLSIDRLMLFSDYRLPKTGAPQ